MMRSRCGGMLVVPLLLGLLSSCNDSSFSGKKALGDEADPPKVAEAIPETPPVVVTTVDEEDNLAVSEYPFGEPDPAVDYLFVIDNSVSMGPILADVNKGYASIVGTNSFPPNSKVAVMTTMIGDPVDFAKTHSSVATYTFIENEPGFLNFVDKASIDAFVALDADFANDFPVAGCANKWFSPEDVNADGVPCLLAATQSVFSALISEPGIHAFQQLLLKHAGTPLFRENALLNVIFVSDTHDPGVDNADLKAATPVYNELVTMANVDNKLRNVKFHALAPEVQCTGEGTHDFSYFTLVAASAGLKQDPCATDDYQAFLKAMIEASVIDAPNFNLEYSATQIKEVLVDGVATTEFTVSEDGKAISIPSLDPKTPVTVQVVYSI
ncbi:MAG: hypothetical protein HRU19_24065 [Pseudobacteriovorax sp.]|nr:hypothetical protein [Pseudobacteriovorax sp.]